MTLQTERLRTVERIKAFLKVTSSWTSGRKAGTARTGSCAGRWFGCATRRRTGPGRARCARTAADRRACPRAQVPRLVAKYRRTGRVEDRRGANSVRPFARVYTPADIRVLAEADEIGRQLCGPAYPTTTRWSRARTPRACASGSATATSRAFRASGQVRPLAVGLRTRRAYAVPEPPSSPPVRHRSARAQQQGPPPVPAERRGHALREAEVPCPMRNGS